MENHHVIVPPPTGRPIKQGVDVNSVRLPWNSRKTWELAFIENLTLAFTLLYFFLNAKCSLQTQHSIPTLYLYANDFIYLSSTCCSPTQVKAGSASGYSSSLDWKLQTFSFKLQDDMAEALKAKKMYAPPELWPCPHSWLWFSEPHW